MPAKNPRINIVLEKPIYEAIKSIAKKEGISISLKAPDLLREALEVHEQKRQRGRIFTIHKCTHDPRCEMQETEDRKQDARCTMQDTR